MGELSDLREQLRLFAEHDDSNRKVAGSHARPFKLLTDVGAGCRVQARLDDVTRVSLHVGLGVWPELSLDEACAYISAKVVAMQQQLNRSRQELVAAMADLELVDLGIRALSTGATTGGDDPGDDDDDDT